MEVVNKKIIGRKDLVSFPEFELTNVPVKIDSGAYSSSMHCQSIEIIEFGDKEQLRVVFLDSGISGYTGKEVIFDEFKTKIVKSSNGVAQERFFVKGTVRLFGETYETVFSLTERTGLRNPILLGRRLLNKRFLIDTSKTNCSYKYENK
ncbi:ATP-dependent zinc protease family protein [Fluviicola chungangensis]|uniref:Peptidase n=1 Tax=Fluviicola chungangensis TaxID=2597671 RepID=A0A556MMM7_9FLAO|nr:RimK/LysX family protein [Fluviicola chungangensis]TSJ41190.1 peptidase [Fluviicola chungangensis]